MFKAEDDVFNTYLTAQWAWMNNDCFRSYLGSMRASDVFMFPFPSLATVTIVLMNFLLKSFIGFGWRSIITRNHVILKYNT